MRNTKFLILEIEPNNLKGMETLLTKEGTVNILKYHQSSYDTPPNDQEFTKIIKGFLSQGKFKTKKALVSLPKSEIITKTIDLPPMPANDMKKIIYDEFYTFRAFKDDYAVLQYFPLDSNENNNSYLAIGIPRKTVLKWLNILSKAGLSVYTLDSPDIASFRSFFYLNSQKKEMKDYSAFIHTGKEETSLFLGKSNKVAFYREFSLGEQDLVQSEGISNWTREVAGTITFFTKEKKQTVNKAYLSGSISRQPDFLTNLQATLGINVESFNFDWNIIANNEDFTTSNLNDYASLIGLLLNSRDTLFPVNLIPANIKEGGKDILKTTAIACILVSLVSLFSYSSYYLISNRQANIANISYLKNVLNKLDGSLVGTESIELEFSKVQKEKEKWDLLLQTYSYQDIYEAFFSILKHQVSGLTVNNFDYDGHKTIRLSVLTADFDNAYSFREQLLKTALYESVTIHDFYSEGQIFVASVEVKLK